MNKFGVPEYPGGWKNTVAVNKWDNKDGVFLDDRTDLKSKQMSYKNVKFGRISQDIGVSYKNSTYNVRRNAMIYIHAPNANDFLLLGSESYRIPHLHRFRLSNPFKNMETSNSVKPICKQWLCVSLSIFEENSYARLYYLDWDILNEGIGESEQNANKKKFKTDDANKNRFYFEELLESRTIYTFNVVNITGKVDYLEWNADFNTVLESKDQEMKNAASQYWEYWNWKKLPTPPPDTRSEKFKMMERARYLEAHHDLRNLSFVVRSRAPHSEITVVEVTPTF